MADSNFRCEACDITLNSIEQYMQHTTGRKHLNKVQAAGNQSVTENVGKMEQTRNENNQEFGSQTKGDRKFVFTSEDTPSSLPEIDLPPPPPPPPPAGQKRKADDMNGCDICQVFYNSSSQRDVHLSGKKHQKKMKTMTEISTTTTDPLGLMSEPVTNLGSCELCHVAYSSVIIRDQHLSGAKHRKKVQLAEVTHQEPDMCTLCNVKYTSPANKLIHIKGRKHLRNVQSHNTPETAPVKNATCFRCMFCNISVNSLEQLEIHRQGNKHKAILQKMKEQQQGRVIDDRSVVVGTQGIRSNVVNNRTVTMAPQENNSGVVGERTVLMSNQDINT